MNETETQKLYQIIFGGDRSEGWQSWKRNLAAEASGNEGVAGAVGKVQKAATNFKGGTSMTRGYRQIWCPIHPNAQKNGYVLEHILVCEMALGDFLPPGAVPHHKNEIKNDNRPDNLVLCESRAFHNLLHKRMRALKECGHEDWHKCKYCHIWSSPADLFVMTQKGETVAYHRACIQDYKRKKREAAGKPMGPPRGARGPYKDPTALAFEACGNADWLRCQYCGVYEPPEKLSVYQPAGREKRGRHRECHLENQRNRRAAAKNAELRNPSAPPMVSP